MMAQEASWLYMEMKNKNKRRYERTATCPTLACDLIKSKCLQFSSAIGATFLVFLHISTWGFELITSIIFIKDFHGLNFPYLAENQTVTFQTKAVDLQFSLMILFFIFYLLYLLCSNSWRFLHIIFKSTASNCLQSEDDDQAGLLRLSRRFDLVLSQASACSLVQFCLQLGGTVLTSSTFSTIRPTDWPRLSSLLPSLVASSVAQLTSLSLGQYFAWQVHAQKSVSLRSSLVYLAACLTNSLAVLTSCCLLYIQISLVVQQALARYHLLALLLLVAITALIAALVQLVVRLYKVSEGGELDKINVRNERSANIINLIGRFVI